ncbi:MAG: PucR family transcriptional regulator [Clostridia bacterium]|nr:PucR family transcriptional regulator [Clostridia bacterium]
MIRIKELFRLKNLKNLRLIAGDGGLERTVTAAVLLEYDPSRMQLPDFYKGDLVVTTLAYARGDNQLVAHSLLALMNQGIAGLLVKTAYFDALPRDVVDMANSRGTPLFLFDETYIEEVILEVTELIRGKRHFSGYEQELDALKRGGLTAEQMKEHVRRIDPVGCAMYRLAAIIPDGRLNALEERVYAALNAEPELTEHLICMEWRRKLIVLSRMEAAEEEHIGRLLECAGITGTEICAGIAEIRTEPEEFGMALCEAVYAARAAKLCGRAMITGSELGLYAYLFPMSENAYVRDQCLRQMESIREYDHQNRTSLEQTARVYVENRMEIAAAAKALFQHPNTVRYRLTKIQKLMGMEDDALFGPMLSLMVNLSRILEEEGRT